MQAALHTATSTGPGAVAHTLYTNSHKGRNSPAFSAHCTLLVLVNFFVVPLGQKKKKTTPNQTKQNKKLPTAVLIKWIDSWGTWVALSVVSVLGFGHDLGVLGLSLTSDFCLVGSLLFLLPSCSLPFSFSPK